MESFICPKCKKPLLLKTAMDRTFYGCTGFPKCKATFPVDGEGGPSFGKDTAKTKNFIRRGARRKQIER